METMFDLPKIVQDRLQAAVPRDAHPEADLLTAFAEQALSGIERENIVRHLARCGDCREVVALSIPPLETVSRPAEDAASVPAHQSAERSRSWFAWPNLRWAAMAAGVVIVGSVLVLRPGQQPNSMVPSKQLVAENKGPAPAADSKVDAAFEAKLDAKANSIAPAVNLPSSLASARRTRADRLAADQSLRADRGELASERERARTARGSVASLANQGTDSLGTKRFFYQDKELPPQASAPSPGPTLNSVIAESDSLKRSTETVEVTGEATQIQTTPVEEKLMARAEPQAISIEKAKPAAKAGAASQAPKNEVVSSQENSSSRYLQKQPAAAVQMQGASRSKDVPAQWALANGKLQRSVDSGSTWEVALQLQHALLAVGNRGSDVWVGGEAGTLFHSVDSGATWTILQPSSKAGTLTTDIVAIDIRSPAEVVLSTSNYETWATLDAGKTWEKR
jgi:hypothetical protein